MKDLTLKEAREAAGLSYTELAAKIGVSSQTVYNWETGRYSPSKPSQIAILLVLGRGEDEIRF